MTDTSSGAPAAPQKDHGRAGRDLKAAVGSAVVLLGAIAASPYGCYIHGNNDTTGALRSIETATTGLKWELAQPRSKWSARPPKRT